MNISTHLSPEAMQGIGIGLCAVGMILGRLPHHRKKQHDLQTSGALKLRKAVQEEKPSQSEAAKNLRFQRASIFGGLMLMSGLITIMVGVWRTI